MKDIKKRLLSELDVLVPKMSDELRDYPITTNCQKRKFKFSYYLIGALACLIILVSILPFALIKDTKESCYLFEVNPTIMLVTDKKGNVTQIKGGNSDADELLLGLKYDELIGLTIEEVTIQFVDQFMKLGYFDSDSYENVMKVSSVNSNVNISEIINNYTNEKGYFVAVLDNIIDCTEFNNQFNLNLATTDDIVNYISSLSDLTLENEVENEDYTQFYKERYLKSYLTERILDDIERLEQIKDYLTDIDIIYDEIYEISFLKDYWLTKKFYENSPSSIPDDLKLLMNQMEVLLEKYNSISKTVITSGTELKVLSVAVSAIPIEEIKYFIIEINNYLNSNEFESKISILIDCFKILDKEIADKLDKYCKIPSNLEEYINQVRDMHLDNYDAKVMSFKNDYEKPKASITKEEYKTYLNNIIDKYGSLENLWNKN